MEWKINSNNQMWWQKYTTAAALVRCREEQAGSIKGRVTMEKAVSKQTWNSERWNSLPQIMQSTRSFICDAIQVITCDTVKVQEVQYFSVCVCMIWGFLILPTVEMIGTRFLKHRLITNIYLMQTFSAPVRSYKAIQPASKKERYPMTTDASASGNHHAAHTSNLACTGWDRQ